MRHGLFFFFALLTACSTFKSRGPASQKSADDIALATEQRQYLLALLPASDRREVDLREMLDPSIRRPRCEKLGFGPYLRPLAGAERDQREAFLLAKLNRPFSLANVPTVDADRTQLMGRPDDVWDYVCIVMALSDGAFANEVAPPARPDFVSRALRLPRLNELGLITIAGLANDDVSTLPLALQLLGDPRFNRFEIAQLLNTVARRHAALPETLKIVDAVLASPLYPANRKVLARNLFDLVLTGGLAAEDRARVFQYLYGKIPGDLPTEHLADVVLASWDPRRDVSEAFAFSTRGLSPLENTEVLVRYLSSPLRFDRGAELFQAAWEKPADAESKRVLRNFLLNIDAASRRLPDEWHLRQILEVAKDPANDAAPISSLLMTTRDRKILTPTIRFAIWRRVCARPDLNPAQKQVLVDGGLDFLLDRQEAEEDIMSCLQSAVRPGDVAYASPAYQQLVVNLTMGPDKITIVDSFLRSRQLETDAMRALFAEFRKAKDPSSIRVLPLIVAQKNVDTDTLIQFARMMTNSHMRKPTPEELAILQQIDDHPAATAEVHSETNRIRNPGWGQLDPEALERLSRDRK